MVAEHIARSPRRPRLMPLGFQMTFLTPVRKGYAAIAQRFNAGCRCRAGRVPKGRMKNSLLNRPFGIQGGPTAIPALKLKRWAILVSSLWDEDARILVALAGDACATANG
jgi:hypothetical protein